MRLLHRSGRVVFIVIVVWGILTATGETENLPQDLSPYVKLGHLLKLQVYRNPVLDRQKKSVVSSGKLIREGIEQVPVGSGTIISPDGLILTNYHVYNVRDAFQYDEKSDTLYVRSRVSHSMVVYRLDDGDPLKSPVFRYMAVPVSLDPSHDTALLKIHQNAGGKKVVVESLPFARFANPFGMRINEMITILGYPAKGGDTLTITDGKFLGYYRNRFFPGRDGFIKTDAAMSPGNSGGAAVNLQGLVGVPTSVTPPGLAGSDMGYIQPVTWIAKALKIAEYKFEFTVQDLPLEWLKSPYNTDETRSNTYLVGWIISSHTMRPLEAEVLFMRPDRSLEEIQSLHQKLQLIVTVQAVQRLHEQGLSDEEIAARLQYALEDVQRLRSRDVSAETDDPDVQRYARGEFFYTVTRCDEGGFFITDVPRDHRVKLYAFADDHRPQVKVVKTRESICEDLGKIVLFKY